VASCAGGIVVTTDIAGGVCGSRQGKARRQPSMATANRRAIDSMVVSSRFQGRLRRVLVALLGDVPTVYQMVRSR